MIQFVLHTASMYNGDWEEFMRKTAKIFKGHIPDSLLIGLKRNACPQLQIICYRYMLDNLRHEERLQLQKEEHEEKVKRWKERRNKGNHIAWCNYLENKRKRDAYEKELLESQKQMERQAFDEYVQKMKPRWDNKMQDIKSARDRQLQTIWDVTHSLQNLPLKDVDD